MANPNWEKGMPKSGGRKKGTPNKTTQKARDIFLKLMEGELSHVSEALEEIRLKDRKAYLYILAKYFPYFLPKQYDMDISIENTDLPFEIEISNRKKEDSS